MIGREFLGERMLGEVASAAVLARWGRGGGAAQGGGRAEGLAGRPISRAKPPLPALDDALRAKTPLADHGGLCAQPAGGCARRPLAAAGGAGAAASRAASGRTVTARARVTAGARAFLGDDARPLRADGRLAHHEYGKHIGTDVDVQSRRTLSLHPSWRQRRLQLAKVRAPPVAAGLGSAPPPLPPPARARARCHRAAAIHRGPARPLALPHGRRAGGGAGDGARPATRAHLLAGPARQQPHRAAAAGGEPPLHPPRPSWRTGGAAAARSSLRRRRTGWSRCAPAAPRATQPPARADGRADGAARARVWEVGPARCGRDAALVRY